MVTRGIVLASPTEAREVDISIYYLWNSGHVQPRIPPCFFHPVVAFDLPCDPSTKKGIILQHNIKIAIYIVFQVKKTAKNLVPGQKRRGTPSHGDVDIPSTGFLPLYTCELATFMETPWNMPSSINVQLLKLMYCS